MYKCSICDDPLICSEDDTSRNCATPCGHVFHFSCIQTWFKVKTDHANSVARSPKVHCPFGCRQIKEQDLLRIFLDLDHDNSQLEHGFKLKSRKALENELEEMKKKLTAKDVELQELSEQLAQAHENHEIEVSNLIAMYQSSMNEHENTGLRETSVPQYERLQFNQSTVIQPMESTENGIRIGSLVVWPSQDDTMENGTVRWLGSIDGIPYAGVQFEHKIGNYDPSIPYMPIFVVRPGYGRLMRVRELFAGSDVYGPEEELKVKFRVLVLD